MESITQIYRIGYGPSSSHTIGPRRAAEMFLDRNPRAASFRVTLYGSLAATGKGHLTDAAILAVLEAKAPTEIVWKPEIFQNFHPNGMLFESFDKEGKQLDDWLIYSIGGGVLANEHFNEQRGREVYPLSKMADILDELNRRGLSYWEYVEENEDPDIWDYLAEVWSVMRSAIQEGLDAEGVLPGGLGVRRKAASYLIRAQGYSPGVRSRGNVYAYALAVSEQNASGGKIVTAPTCGSCGVVPAGLHHLQQTREVSAYCVHWLRPAFLLMWCAPMLLFRVPKSAVRAKWEWLVPWERQPAASYSGVPCPKSNMLQRWLWSITSD